MYKEYIKRKEKIIISAIDILDEVGIQGLTTKELAKRQGISEPALYRQFEGKQEIVLTILDRFAAFDDDIRNTIIEQKVSPRAGILFFAESYASYYQNYPQITTVLFSLDVFKYDEKINSRMMEILDKRYKFVEELVQKAKEEHEIETEMSSEEMSEFILGIIWSTIYKWKIGGCKTMLKEQIMYRVQWLLDKLV